MLNKKFLVLGFLNLFFIAGCTSNPDVASIEPSLKAQWSKCDLFKVTNIKKTNGIERGTKYQINLSYNIEATRDLIATPQTYSVSTSIQLACPAVVTVEDLLMHIAVDGSKRMVEGHPIPGTILLPKGTSYEVNTSYLMIKSEKGWIVQ